MKRFSSRAADSQFSGQRCATGDAAIVNQSASSEVLGRLPTVLIVESNAIVRNLLRDIFSRHGFIVLDAVSHSEAMHLLRVIADEEVDLLVIEQSENSGAGSLARGAADLRPAVKVLFTFEGEVAGISLESADMPGSAFLQKPFTEARLLEEVTALLDPTTQ
jgi:two-component SAPR family response regulator